MARKYLAGKTPAPVSDRLLGEARERLTAAQARLRAAEDADPGSPGWEDEYAGALAAARGAERRVEALEQLRAAQVEKSGRRAAAVKAAAGELTSAASELAASRDQVAAAAEAHLRALAALAVAEDAHSGAVAAARARVAALGLAVRNDLAPDGAEHAEGTLPEGLRAGGVDWTALPAGGVAAHALREVYGRHGPGHPLAEVGKYRYRAHEVQARPDGLAVPGLADVGAEVPQPPRPPRVERVAVADGLEPPVLADGSGWHMERAAVSA